MEGYQKVWVVAILSVFSLLTSVVAWQYGETRLALSSGYCENQKLGSDGTYWQKCGK